MNVNTSQPDWKNYEWLGEIEVRSKELEFRRRVLTTPLKTEKFASLRSRLWRDDAPSVITIPAFGGEK